MNEPSSQADVTVSAQALLAGEGLPFPHLPADLTTALAPRSPSVFSTRELATSPYAIEHFVAELGAHPDMPDYAIVGIDGHGINSWALHCYLVTDALALFIQLPWGGAYTDSATARAEIGNLFDWAADVQARLALASRRRQVGPESGRLTVVATRFGDARWRDPSVAGNAWQSPAGMKDAILSLLDSQRTQGGSHDD